MSTPAHKPLPIVRMVIKSHARKLVARFFDGASPLTLAREHGLSRTGVEELIRAHTSKPRRRH